MSHGGFNDSGFGLDPKLIGDAMAAILHRTPALDLRDHEACERRLREAGFSWSSIARHLPRAIVACRMRQREEIKT